MPQREETPASPTFAGVQAQSHRINFRTGAAIVIAVGMALARRKDLGPVSNGKPG